MTYFVNSLNVSDLIVEYNMVLHKISVINPSKKSNRKYIYSKSVCFSFKVIYTSNTIRI